MIGGLNLLERSMSYALGSLVLATENTLARPTPCAEWDVRALLCHVTDALAALVEAAEAGWVQPAPEPSTESVHGLVEQVRSHACRLLGAWTNLAKSASVAVGDRQLPHIIVAATGAIEIATHGWDLARGCGADRPIPAGLAEELLELAPVLVTAADRPHRFAPVVYVPLTAPVGDRLIGFLGRDPR